MSIEKTSFVGNMVILLVSMLGLMLPRAGGAAALRGSLTLDPDQPDKPVEVTLKKGRRVVSREVLPPGSNNFEFKDLPNGRYQLVIASGDQKIRRRVDLCCGPNSISFVNITLDRRMPVIMVNFPIEAPDIVDIRELSRDYPEAVLKEFDKASFEMYAGRISRAAERLQRVVKEAPGFYSARARLGMVYHIMGCYPEAEQEYLRAHELNAKAAQPLVNLGSLYLDAAGARLGDNRQYLDEAIALLHQALGMHPTSSIANCLLGTAYYKKGSYAAAEESLLKGIGKERRLNAARLMLANVYIRQERWKDAVENIDTYLRENRFSQDRKKIQSLRKEIARNLK